MRAKIEALKAKIMQSALSKKRQWKEQEKNQSYDEKTVKNSELKVSKEELKVNDGLIYQSDIDFQLKLAQDTQHYDRQQDIDPTRLLKMQEYFESMALKSGYQSLQSFLDQFKQETNQLQEIKCESK